MTEYSNHVTLIGDSTLDNVVWVSDRTASVTGNLEKLSIRVVNLAADGFTTSDVLHGAEPVLCRAKREETGDPFPDPHSFAPLNHLSSDEHSMYVISVGGNDIRHILSDMSQSQQVIQSLQENYAAIVSQIRF